MLFYISVCYHVINILPIRHHQFLLEKLSKRATFNWNLFDSIEGTTNFVIENVNGYNLIDVMLIY